MRACTRSPLPREGFVSGDTLAAASPAARGAPEGGLAELRRLPALSRAVAQAASLDDILDRAAREAAGMLGADQTVLMLVGDDGRAHSRAVHGIDPSVAVGLEGELNERLKKTVSRPLDSNQGLRGRGVDEVRDDLIGCLQVLLIVALAFKCAGRQRDVEQSQSQKEKRVDAPRRFQCCNNPPLTLFVL